MKPKRLSDESKIHTQFWLTVIHVKNWTPQSFDSQVWKLTRSRQRARRAFQVLRLWYQTFERMSLFVVGAVAATQLYPKLGKSEERRRVNAKNVHFVVPQAAILRCADEQCVSLCCDVVEGVRSKFTKRLRLSQNTSSRTAKNVHGMLRCGIARRSRLFTRKYFRVRKVSTFSSASHRYGIAGRLIA